MFWIRYTELENGAPVEVEQALRPAPTEIEYPTARDFKVLASQDGGIIVQRPLVDSRPRRWVWRSYPASHAAFAEQWPLLEALEYRSRLAAGLPGYVGIWEDSSRTGGFNKTDGNGDRIFTRVKVLQVDRVPRSGGGPPIYDATFEFYVVDPDYRAF